MSTAEKHGIRVGMKLVKVRGSKYEWVELTEVNPDQPVRHGQQRRLLLIEKDVSGEHAGRRHDERTTLFERAWGQRRRRHAIRYAVPTVSLRVCMLRQGLTDAEFKAGTGGPRSSHSSHSRPERAQGG